MVSVRGSELDAFAAAFGSSHIATSAYQTRPTMLVGILEVERGFTKAIGSLTAPIESLRISGQDTKPYLLIMIFTRCDCHNKSMLSCEKFRPKPATRRFDESFAPVPSSMSAICTLARPRSSTKVSLGFNLTRHSSPSLGLHPAYCDSTRAWCLTSQTQPAEVAFSLQKKKNSPLCQYTFIAPCRVFSMARGLAHEMRSLVRVSRRVVGGADMSQTTFPCGE